METNQKMVREVLTSPSQLHLIETVPEEEPSQVDGKLQSRLLSPTPTGMTSRYLQTNDLLSMYPPEFTEM